MGIQALVLILKVSESSPSHIPVVKGEKEMVKANCAVGKEHKEDLLHRFKCSAMQHN